MNIKRLDEWDLTAGDERQIASLLERGFQEDFGGRSYHLQRHHVRFVAYENDVLIGHMAMRYQDVRLGNQLTQIWGLAEVVTAPEARGQGVATQLLRAAIAFTKSTPAKFFVLFGNRPIYAANGFVKQANATTYSILDDARTGGAETATNTGLMVLQLGDQPWDETAPLDLIGPKF